MSGSKPSLLLTPLSFARMLSKRWLAISVIALVFAVMGAVAVYLLPDIYRAESLVLVEQQKIPEKLVESTVQIELQDRLATISQQILSGTQLQKIIDKHQLYSSKRASFTPEELIEAMRRDIEIKTEKGWSRNRPGAFRVFFRSRNAQEAATVTNEITNLFVEENLKSREVQATGASEFLASQLEEARTRLLEQEAKLADFKRRNSGQLPGQENGLLMSLTQIQTQAVTNNDALSRARAAKAMLESDLRTAEDALQRQLMETAAAVASTSSADAPGLTPAAPVAAQQVAGQAALKSEQLEQLLEQLKRRYTDQHPQVRLVQAELLRVRQQEAREADAAKVAVAAATPVKGAPLATTGNKAAQQSTMFIEQQRERVEKFKRQIAIIEQEIAEREGEQKRHDAALAKNQSVLAKLPMNEQEMIAVTRDYEVSKHTYETLLQKSFTANTAEDLERRQKSERFMVLDSARPPERPTSPNRPILYLLTSVLSVFLGALAGMALEFRNNVLLGDWELPQDVWVLGRIPVVKPPVES